MQLIPSLSILTLALKAEYANLFNTAQVKPEALGKVQNAYKAMNNNKARYQAVAAAFNLPGVPWYLIAVLHMRESTFDFTTHLHNGDPLTGRTYHVPAGRPIAAPKAGAGRPYSWEESAVDAIFMKLNDSPAWYNNKQDGSTESLLNKIEAFNGGGYRSKGVPSPYLWSDSTVQQPGKFIADGVFSSKTVDTQLGAGTLLKYFLEQEAKKK